MAMKTILRDRLVRANFIDWKPTETYFDASDTTSAIDDKAIRDPEQYCWLSFTPTAGPSAMEPTTFRPHSRGNRNPGS